MIISVQRTTLYYACIVYLIRLIRNIKLAQNVANKTLAGSDVGTLAALALKNLTWTFKSIPMHVCMYVCMHVCMHACMYAYIRLGASNSK